MKVSLTAKPTIRPALTASNPRTTSTCFRHVHVVSASLVALCTLFVILPRFFLWRASDITDDEMLIATIKKEIDLKSRAGVDDDVYNNQEGDAPTASLDGVQPRAFSAWPRELPLPCWDPWENVEPNQQWFDRSVQKRPTREGLLFLKLCKTASSTAASVHLRIARNLARRRRQQHTQLTDTTAATSNWPVCRSRFLHGWAGPKMYQFGQRNRMDSFLWTMLREPTQRYISEFFHFQVTRRNTPVNQRSFQYFLRKGPHADHHTLSWLAVHGYQFQQSDPVDTANAILQDYDFIGLAERFNESVVVLSMLLDIPLRDVLYLSSKQSGGYDGLCYKILPPRLTKPMQRHLQSPEWQAYVAPEVALWKAANASLDLTIDRLGRTRVQEQVQLFQRVLTAAQETCGSITKFPCTPTGEPIPANETDCLVVDMGCGLECIDRVADEFNLPS